MTLEAAPLFIALGLASSALVEAGPASEARPALRPTRYELDLRVDFKEERIDGSARITLRNPGPSRADAASLLLYRLMTVKSVHDEAGATIPFRQTVVAFEDEPRKQVNHVVVSLPKPLAPGGSTVVAVDYGGYLAGYVETGSLYIQDRVDEAFTIIREDAEAYPTVRVPSSRVNRAAGLPEFDYEARITVPETHAVANGGTLVERTVRDGLATYTYRNARPAWRMDFAIASFGLLEGAGLRVFFLPGDAEGAERVRKAAADSMALYAQWFGPLHDPPAFTVIEIPDGWGSQADVTSILQAAAAFKDPGRLHEVYHEVSHLWNVRSLDQPYCRWNEGLASFLEELTRERLEGGPPVDAGAERMAAWLVKRAGEEPRLRTVPMIDYGKEEMAGYSYRVGMLMFYALHRLVGQQAFGSVVGGHYQKHFQGRASTEEFVREAQAAAGRDLTPFFHDWLYTTRWCDVLTSGVKAQDLASLYRESPGRDR